MSTAAMPATAGANAEDTRAAPQPRAQKISIEQHSATGLLWFAGWLFTIGFLHLPLGKALLGVIVWPYYLGTAVSGWLG